MYEKTVGYALLVVGLLVILFAAYSVVQVFTGRAEPVHLFNLPGVSVSTEDLLSGASAEERAALAETNRGKAPALEILPASTLNQTTNVVAHLFFMGFIAGIGQKISGLGIQLIRTIEVKLTKSPLPTKQ